MTSAANTITTSPMRGKRLRGWRSRRSRALRGEIGWRSTSERRSWRSLYSSTSIRPSRPSASAYVRRNVLTYVGPGRRSHSSFSSARRYLARIFVCASISVMSIRERIRSSRRLAPMSGIRRRRLLSDARFHGLCRTCAVALAQRGDDALDVGLRDEHLARLGALVAGDDVAALEHVDEAPRTGVTEPQPALQHGRRGGAHLGDEADRVLQERVLVGAERVVARRCDVGAIVLGVLQQLLAELGLALLAPELRDRLDLRLVDVRALDALQARRADW